LQIGTGYRQYDWLQKFLYQPNPKLSHSLNLQYSTSSDIPRYDRLTLLSGTQPRFAEWYYGPQQRLLAAYTFSSENPHNRKALRPQLPKLSPQ
jgi:hemoglobin/transferrin/lactoferrin receptor protein